VTYGINPFGTTPYGGLSLESGGVSLESANPAIDSSGSPVDTPVQFTLYCLSEFESYTLQLFLNGARVLLDSEFVTPFGGTVVFDGPNLTVDVSSHPDFPDGNPIQVDISVVTLAGSTATFSYVFNVAGAHLDGVETVTLVEELQFGFHVRPEEEFVLEEGISPFIANATEALTQTVGVSTDFNISLEANENVSLFESVQIGSLRFYSIDETTIGVEFPEVMEAEQVSDPEHFDVTPKQSGAYPVLIFSATPVQEVVQEGTGGQVIPPLSGRPVNFTSFTFDTVTGSFLPEHVGHYLFIQGTHLTTTIPYRIRSYLGSVVTLDREVSYTDPANGVYVPPLSPWDPGSFVPGTGSLHWTQKAGAKEAILKVSETTLGKSYMGSVEGLIKQASQTPYSGSVEFIAFGVAPRVLAANCVADDGSLIVSFDKDMRIDSDLIDSANYAITGPHSEVIRVREVRAIDVRTVFLLTAGMLDGLCSVRVSTVGPLDEVGNTIDPLHCEVSFVGSVPIGTRSIFTDHGPIAKPALTVQSGTGATIQVSASTYFGTLTSDEVVLSGGNFTTDYVGLFLELSGSLNGGSFLVRGVVGPDRLKVQASFHLPDPENGTLPWRLFDPRTGEIADSPEDVTVRINGHRVAVLAVSGLLGQVIVDTVPAPEDDVVVDYDWIPDPTVELRRLNSKEFRLNSWLHDAGVNTTTQHIYRYRSVLVSPALYRTDDVLAEQAQPLLRDMHYRAYERAYSVALNDPALFVLNTPFHRIAYPPLSRQVQEVTVSYPADVLPEVDPTAPWSRRGAGLASVVLGSLVVEDNKSGPYPEGQGIFWTRTVDLTFPSVYAATWRMRINSTSPDGVNTGVAVGFSDENRVVVLGYLLDNGVRKVGFLKQGYGNRQANPDAWTGGVSFEGNPTGLPFELDWSILHSYRFFRDRDGVVRFYVDGEIVENLRITENELPYLDELDAPFNEVQNVYFGSLGRQATNLSTWDFVRYVTVPINPEQSAPSVFVSYEGDTYPENAMVPWTPVGYHGNESLVDGELYLDSTSSTNASEIGLVGGDFKGFTRIEPLLGMSSDVTLDLGVCLRTYTHGVAPNAVMAAIDDGARLVQVCFFPSKPQPKLSYPGRSLPQEASPKPWTSLGTATAYMVGRILRIEDTSVLDGRVFAINDLEPIGSDTRIIETSLDWFAEAKFQVFSYTPDGSSENFAGATIDIFDGTHTVGILTRVDPDTGERQIAWHSDGQVRSSASAIIPFDWFDGKVHIYRVVKSTSGNLVSLFIDNQYKGSLSYDLFDSTHGNPTYSFGSSTLSSMAACSVVEWHYANVWRAQSLSGVRHYVGIWKGSDPNSLIGYHLPLRTSGQAMTAGNTLTNSLTDFVALGVQVGDDLVIDHGVNRGVYSILSVDPTVLTFSDSFPQTGLTSVSYRIPAQTDWRATSQVPIRTTGIGTTSLTVLSDSSKDFVSLGVRTGDDLVIESGPNAGTFPISSVTSTDLTILGSFTAPLEVSYLVVLHEIWNSHHYKLIRSPSGFVSLFQDLNPEPLISIDYSEVNLPPSSVGIPYLINRGLPSVSWGAFDSENISQTAWDFVRYGVTRPPSEVRIVPAHQVLNQRNIMSSPEHLFGTIRHNHTNFACSSTGIPYPWEEYSLTPELVAFTRLNEGTPLVPQTQTYEIRRPLPEVSYLSILNQPTNQLNSKSFRLNDATYEVTIVVPDDVLYNSLQVLEKSSGDRDLISPISDEVGLVKLGKLSWQNTICVGYQGDVLPEQDLSYGTPWVIQSEDPAQVSTTVFGGILTYAVGSNPTRTIYRNATPLTDPIGLTTRVDFRLRLLSDSTLGMGDSGVRFGFSALGLTAALAFVATPLGDREVQLIDLNSNEVLGSISFDYLDGDYHTYRLVKNVSEGAIDFLVDP